MSTSTSFFPSRLYIRYLCLLKLYKVRVRGFGSAAKWTRFYFRFRYRERTMRTTWMWIVVYSVYPVMVIRLVEVIEVNSDDEEDD